jgi:phosphoglycolate phosphatase-like HAD superfamily hydrolase
MRLAIDFDGTIADTNRAKADWILGKLGAVVDPWRCDRTNCVPIIGAAAYEEMSDYVYERASTLATSEVPGASAALLRLSARAELHVVTARPARRTEFAREWFIQNGILHLVKGFHSSNDTSKEEICRMVGASVLIDDDLRHLEDVHLAGLRRILFQNRPDDTTRSTGEVVICRSWSEVVGALETGCFGDRMCNPDASDGLTV